MQFLADENVFGSLIRRLRECGHVVVRVRDLAPGTPDEGVVRLSARNEQILLTEDNDFGQLVFRSGLTAYGIVMIRFAKFEGEFASFAPGVATRISEIGSELVGHLTIIEPKRTRRRSLPEVSVGRNQSE